MFGIAWALFAGFMSMLMPILVSYYSQWIQEINTPVIFRIHPYLPMWGSLVVMVAITIFFIYASIREYHIRKRKRA